MTPSYNKNTSGFKLPSFPSLNSFHSPLTLTGIPLH